ncbi:H-NS histone family protein [Paraburkholderia sp. SARCC-3016]|uniref:H-NS histone family protein n=1 Tax=Paraburkholderia sp. SARCC-3016 TaxID=3058611 RepID=UPI002806B6DA|nr:H-NS histone family protein [Paraburkholderia sp. SARCC-3016]MDQ7979862.1 H-NS histone family protein [Paraburkholderia sp. SARCC-3016]
MNMKMERKTENEKLEGEPTSYRDLLRQREALQKQIDAALEHERAMAIENVRAIVSEYSLTPEQVFAKTRHVPVPRPPKYRDPASGATWSGRGREPIWLKGQSRDRFLIQD